MAFSSLKCRPDRPGREFLLADAVDFAFGLFQDLLRIGQLTPTGRLAIGHKKNLFANYQAAFQVINDIQDYNKLGGLKKQLAALYAQVYTVKEVCSHQYQAMVALVKLKSYGITEDHILNLNNYLQRNKINLETPTDLERYGSMKEA